MSPPLDNITVYHGEIIARIRSFLHASLYVIISAVLLGLIYEQKPNRCDE